MTSTVERLVAMKNSRTAMAAELATLKATLNAASAWTTATSPAPSLSSPTQPLVVNDVVRELDMRALKKANIVLSGLRSSSTTNNSTAVHYLLRDELRINAVVFAASVLASRLLTSIDSNDCHLTPTLVLLFA